MNQFLALCLAHGRTVLSLFGLLMMAGLSTYYTIPLESQPDVKIPYFGVEVSYRGISPQDAELLLVKPLERQVRTLEGIKELRATAYEGGAHLGVEFWAGVDLNRAQQQLREKVNQAKADLPAEVDEPEITEVNLSLLPVLTVNLSGHLPRRALYKIAEDLKDQIEAQVPAVLAAKIVGNQEEAVEILLPPSRFENLGVAVESLLQIFSRNNKMVASGSLRGERGHFPIKVPGLVDTLSAFLAMPLVVEGDHVLTLGEVAQVRRTFKDPETYARFQGVPSVSLEISKRTGENLIQTIQKVRAAIHALEPSLPRHLKISYSQDKSTQITDMLGDLHNNIISAILLVMGVIVLTLGRRSSFLVGIAVPGSFLMGLWVLGLLGLTLNIVVLFSLILSVGMLVDGAIIVVEYADRRLAEGADAPTAYREAAQRMAWPVITSTLTILAVFLPLLYWPGVVGQFMKYLPLTLMATLGASLLMALIVVPTLGALLARRPPQPVVSSVGMSDPLSPPTLETLERWYVQKLTWCLDRPRRVLGSAVALLVVIKLVHGFFGRGVEFFPNVEPETAIVVIHGRGNLSLDEKDALVRGVEKQVLTMPEFKSVYCRVGPQEAQLTQSLDAIGSLTLEFVDWQQRRPAHVILEDMRQRLSTIPGIRVEVMPERAGPSKGKQIQVQLTTQESMDKLVQGVAVLRQYLTHQPALMEVEDDGPLPGISWAFHIDRSQAAKFGMDVALIGMGLSLLTEGLRVSKYRPSDSQEDMDVLLRFPPAYRTLAELDQLRLPTPVGPLPVSLCVQRRPEPRVNNIQRSQGNRCLTVGADVKPGLVVDTQVQQIKEWLATKPLDPTLSVLFKGEDEEQQKTGAFLMKAFLVALALIAIILVTQFNSFFSMGLVLSAVVLSTIGVLLWLTLTGQPFGIVMGGIGIIALAGIVVSNNIILIDTFDRLRQAGVPLREAIIQTGAERLRPVLLTKLTTVLGLLPIMFGLTLDFVKLEVTMGAPSTQWWTQLSSTIVSGVLFASVLTLIMTPCALFLWHRKQEHRPTP